MRKVGTCLGMAGTHQHAAIAGLERKNVSRLHQIFRTGIAGGGNLNGSCTVGRRDTGGHPGGSFDGYREVGPVRGAVLRHHQGQVELTAALLAEGHADQAARMLGHEIDRLGGNELGGHHQIAFVFPVFGINQHHHLAGTNIVNNVLGR